MPKSRKDAKPVSQRPSKPPATPTSRTPPRRTSRRTGLDPDIATDYLESPTQAEAAPSSEESRLDEDDQDSASVTQQLIYRQMESRSKPTPRSRTVPTSPRAARKTRKRSGKPPKG